MVCKVCLCEALPYPCKCYNSIRRGRPAWDREACLMPVDAQELSCLMGISKRLLGI